MAVLRAWERCTPAQQDELRVRFSYNQAEQAILRHARGDGASCPSSCSSKRRTAAEDIDAAVAEAVARGTPHVGAVRQALDRSRHERGEPPPVGLHLPADRRLDALIVRPHALSTYKRRSSLHPQRLT